MNSRLETAFSAVLVVAAATMGLSLIHREFFNKGGGPTPVALRPSFEKSWQEAMGPGIVIGSPSAAVHIVEFSDLECPGCRVFNSVVEDILRDYPTQVNLVYVSFPLTSIHRFALSAARAAECANAQGRFHQFINAVYAKQDSLGIKPWGSFAKEAGVADTAAIVRCAVDPSPVKRIQDGQALGEKLELHATPTVIVNGWRYPMSPSKSELRRAVAALAAGRRAFDDAGNAVN